MMHYAHKDRKNNMAQAWETRKASLDTQMSEEEGMLEKKFYE